MFMGGEDLRDWARDASPGASLCLGVAAAVPPTTQPVLRSLSDAGLIDVARRKVGPEKYSFIVQRRSRRFVERTPMPVQRGGQRTRRAGTIERRILKLLLLAVSRELPCPTNAAIANLVGLRDELAASYRIRKLQERGLIRVTVPADPRQHRVVTIVASGKSTRGGAR